MSDLARKATARTSMYALGGLLAALAVASLIHFVFFPSSSSQPSVLARSETPAKPPVPSAPPSTQTVKLGGIWGATSESEAGYRVRAKLASAPAASDVSGRTSQISGTVDINENKGRLTVTNVRIDVVVEALKSDNSERDEKIRSLGLESGRFTVATFKLTKPFTLQASAIRGRVAQVSATGVLEIHGVYRTITLPAEMSVSGPTLTVKGSLSFAWNSFGMHPPNISSLVTVIGDPTLEYHLLLTHPYH